jgi:ankyrin repeat protein
VATLTEILTAPAKNVENVRYEAVQYHHLLQVRNDQTRTCLDKAAMLGHPEVVKLLAEKSTAMMTDAINLTNGAGKVEDLLEYLIWKIANRIFMFTSRLCLESIRND